MIMDGILFHNVAEMIPQEDGGKLLVRLPQDVRACLSEVGQKHSLLASGVELRFRIRSGETEIYLRTEPTAEELPVLIAYGDFQGGWMFSAKQITKEKSCIRVRPTDHLPQLQQITKEKGLRFQPEMVRLLLPYTPCVYLGAQGDIEPPHPGDLPAKTLLCHGSSITHGSLALGANASYASQLARALGMDCLNLGVAGACQLEEEVARHIVSRRDWDAATVEMGINMLSFSEEEFRARVRRFVAILAADGRPVYATSLFGYGLGDDPKGAAFRAIVQEETAGKLPFIDGLQLLDDPAMLSEDMVHPAQEGHWQIASRWAKYIREVQG